METPAVSDSHAASPRDILKSRWAPVYFTLAEIPVAALLGGTLNWTAPSLSLLLLSLPTAWSALYSPRIVAIVTGLVAIGGCFIESFWASYQGRPSDLGLAVLVSGVLLALSGFVQGLADDSSSRAGVVEFPVPGVTAQGHSHRPASLDSSTSMPALKRGDVASAELSALLLALQEVVRKIAGDLDLETLPQTIVSTGANLLDARECVLLWWHQSSRTLVPRASSCPAGRRAEDSAERGSIRWVIQNRKPAIRGEDSQPESLNRMFDADPTGPDAIVPLIVGGELLALLTFHEVQCDGPERFGLDPTASNTLDEVSPSGILKMMTPNPTAPAISGSSGSMRAIRTGALVAVNRQARTRYLVSIVAHVSGLALKNAILFRRIEEMATRDGLTGLLTHAAFHEKLSECLADARAERTPLVLILADIDSFKRFNDQHGHQAGDEVLREIARIWRSLLPENALIGRYGGEEFVCVLPGHDLRRGGQLAETLRSQLEQYPIIHAGHELRATASLGIAQFTGGPVTADELVGLADAAMYRAKQAGRNRVCEALS